ncbi:transcription factor SPT20 homolog isoform X2 [Varroa jacobsoni]|uniref:Spt20-like SEP domain-containing protein n=2 Tax=Varroa TaxID=62624 RepID=A0A7M7J2A0_VARDE|nr:transcription factor SPT20 homolog [Varroa destructor]XP_022687623.1 transcription factor SPT20 homolog isoform X2 [Varroa jacobsoni]
MSSSSGICAEDRDRPCPFCGLAGALCDLHSSHGSTSRWKERSSQRSHLSMQLSELYQTELKRLQSRSRLLSPGTHLLEKLVQRDRLQLLELHLFPDGYTLCLPGRAVGAERSPYEDDLLQQVEQGLLPPVLAQLLDSLGHSQLFHSGSLPLSVHNHLQTPTNIQYTLLQPSNLLVASDVQQMAGGWSPEEQLQLEAQVVMATAEPICLEPDISVALVDNYFQYKQKLMTGLIQPKRKRHPTKHPPLFDFVTRLEERRKKKAKPPPSRVKHEAPDALVPAQIDVPKFAKIIPRPEIPSDLSMRLVQEYIMETTPTQASPSDRVTKVSILQAPVDEQYYGVLATQSGETRSQCTFRLGSLCNVHLYLNQFRDIFTEEGRKAVKITHLVPGKAPVVRHTGGFLQVNAQQQQQQFAGSVGGTTAAVAAAAAATQQQAATGRCVTPAQQPPTPAVAPIPSPGPPTPSRTSTPILVQKLSVPPSAQGSSASAASFLSPSPTPSASAPALTGQLGNTVQLNTSKPQAVVQLVKKNIQGTAHSGKPQVILQAGGQPVVVNASSMNMTSAGGVQGLQSIQVHQLGEMKPLQVGGKVLQQMTGSQGSQIALQLTQPVAVSMAGKTTQMFQGGTAKQMQLVTAGVKGSGGQMISHHATVTGAGHGVAPQVTKVQLTASGTTMSPQTTQSIADQVVAQMRNKGATGGGTKTTQVVLQAGQVANAGQIQNIVEQINQQFSQAQKVGGQAGQTTPIAVGTLAAASGVAGAAAPGHGSPASGAGVVVGQTVLQMGTMSGHVSVKNAHPQVVLQPQQVQQVVGLSTGRLVGVTPLLGQHTAGLAKPPQSIVLQTAGVPQVVTTGQTTHQTVPAGGLVRDNRSAMQILSAAVGTAHHATSLQLAAIQRHLQSQRAARSASPTP